MGASHAAVNHSRGTIPVKPFRTVCEDTNLLAIGGGLRHSFIAAVAPAAAAASFTSRSDFVITSGL